MSAKVYANGRELSGKSSGNKSTAAMPDVCLSPPAPPAGPLPIPYPNTAQASNTAEGSKSVKVGDKEVGTLTTVVAATDGVRALGYLRREVDVPADVLIRWDGAETTAVARALPERP